MMNDTERQEAHKAMVILIKECTRQSKLKKPEIPDGAVYTPVAINIFSRFAATAIVSIPLKDEHEKGKIKEAFLFGFEKYWEHLK